MPPVSLRIAAIATAAATTLSVAGCGAERSGAQATTTTRSESAEVATHNGQDVAFVQGMIPQHLQAVDLAALAQNNSTNADVIAVANQIAEAQLAEIQAFKAWLAQWNMPQAGDNAAAAGMVDQATMDKLKTLQGPDFDKPWLQAMISHSQGAIAMAQQEVAHGTNVDVVSIATSTISTDQGDVDKMKQLLGG